MNETTNKTDVLHHSPYNRPITVFEAFDAQLLCKHPDFFCLFRKKQDSLFGIDGKEHGLLGLRMIRQDDMGRCLSRIGTETRIVTFKRCRDCP